MMTANKMKSRASLQGGGLNTVLQYLLNPETINAAAEQQQMVPDFNSVTGLVLDTFNLKETTLYRPMTPQEIQGQRQRAQQAGMEKMQLRQQRLGAMSADAHERDETQIIVATLNALAQIGALNEVLGIARDSEIAAQKVLAGNRRNIASPILKYFAFAHLPSIYRTLPSLCGPRPAFDC